MPISLTPMTARDPHEEHRAATPLELFFDLVFVVAVAFAASAFHHDISADHIGHGFLSYLLVFFAIWWAWVNFTWFASSYDVDDWLYRIVVFIQMTGALVLAAGVPRAFEDREFGVAVIGYVIMRLALVAQWLRASWGDPERRATARRFVLSITLVQVAWIVAALLPNSWFQALFVPLAIVEVLIPVWAESAGRTTWHEEHITERYGLFTIIVLGESVLAASLAIQTIGDLGDITGEIGLIIIGGLLTLYAMWWLYFVFPAHDGIESLRSAIVWSYGHYFIWAAAAAVGVGLSVVIDYATDHAEITRVETGMALAIPVAIFVLGLWIFHDLPQHQMSARGMVMPVAAVLILLTAFTGIPTLLIGLIMVGLVAAKTVSS